MEDLSYGVWKLSTGKIFCPRAAHVYIYKVEEGMGGNVGDYTYEVADGWNNALDLTKDEAKEVANYMIEIWAEFLNSL